MKLIAGKSDGHLTTLVGHIMKGDGLQSTAQQLHSKMRKFGAERRLHLENAGRSFLRHVRTNKKRTDKAAALSGAATLASVALTHPDLKSLLDKALADGIDDIKGFKDILLDQLNDPDIIAQMERAGEALKAGFTKNATKNKRGFEDFINDEPSNIKINEADNRRFIKVEYEA